jgi:hypothetical protein
VPAETSYLTIRSLIEERAMGLASYEIIGNDGVCAAVTEKPKKRLRDEGGGL